MSWPRITTYGKPIFCVKFFHDFINDIIYGKLNKKLINYVSLFTKILFITYKTLGQWKVNDLPIIRIPAPMSLQQFSHQV